MVFGIVVPTVSRINVKPVVLEFYKGLKMAGLSRFGLGGLEYALAEVALVDDRLSVGWRCSPISTTADSSRPFSRGLIAHREDVAVGESNVVT